MHDLNLKFADVWKTAGVPIPMEGAYLLKDTNFCITPTNERNEFIIQEERMGMILGFMDLKFEVSKSGRYKVKVNPSASLEKQNGIYIVFADYEVEDTNELGTYHLERIFSIGYATYLLNTVIVATTLCPNVYIDTYDTSLKHSAGRICEIKPI